MALATERLGSDGAIARTGSAGAGRIGSLKRPRRDMAVGRPARPGPGSRGFTLVELLVVIGIIALLISILMPAVGRAREQGNAIKCAANLRTIGQAFQMYLNVSNQFSPPYKNDAIFLDPADPTQYNDSRNSNAYWGVFFAVVSKLPKETFTCPSNIQKTDANGYPNQYTAYGYNAWGNGTAGLSDAERVKFYGSIDEVALLARNKTTWTGAIGRRMTRVRHPTRTILAQDAWEAALDGGNQGDTYASSVASNRGKLTEYPGHDVEYLRHSKASNVVFVDGHVERLDKTEQTDERYYTGNWSVARSY